jgi:hypothetical protein
METKIKRPLFIGGTATYDLYLEKRPNEGHLYINNVRAKALPGASDYQIIEPTLLEYFDEICKPFDNSTDIDVEDESYLPTSIRVNGKYVFIIDVVGNTFIMNTELGLKEIRDISKTIESVFRTKIIPLLQQVGLHG